MKCIFVLFTILFCSPILEAQNEFSKSKVYAGRSIYNVEKLNSSNDKLFVKNSDNKLYLKKSTILQEMRDNVLNLIETDDIQKNKLLKIVKTALGEKSKALQGQRLIPSYFISGEGKVLEVGFIIDKNTKFTPEDLKLIENAIKDQYSFKMKSNQLRTANYIQFFWPMRL